MGKLFENKEDAAKRANDFPVEKLEWFEQWLEETGERAPDFNQMKRSPHLPELLQFESGKHVKSTADWVERRKELKALLEQYILGKFPDETPALIKSEVLHSRQEHRAVTQQIKLTFDTINKASFTFELMIPEGEGPFPVLLTQANHRRWGLLALSRGYIVGLYPGADIDDQTDAFKKAYPQCDWSLLSRRAWLGSRTLDYILQRDDVNRNAVCITGHSRNGKQSLIAAAMDERIKAVISSSSGSGGAGPFRLNSESRFQESVEFMTRNFPEWFHPRLRFFTGREDYLPVDTHALLGLIAPRPCLISAALNDNCECTFAIEQSYKAAKKVYEFLQSPHALNIRYRPGSHETNAEDIQSYIDWFDDVAVRDEANPVHDRLYHHFDWKAWAVQQTVQSEQSGVFVQSGQSAKTVQADENKMHDLLTCPFDASRPQTAEEKRKRILWSLGEKPALAAESGGRYGNVPLHLMVQFLHLSKPEHIHVHSFNFGGYVRGNLYYKKDLPQPAPVVIWLHPFSYPVGYTGAYTKNEKIYNYLAEQGYAVLAFDQIGFGSRIEEGANFYKRYPHWSKLGKMVSDVSSLIDCLVEDRVVHAEEAFPNGRKGTAQHSSSSGLPELDSNRIYCVGYSLGGMVALYAAALDERIAGVASFSGFTPMRTDTEQSRSGGIRRWWETYGLQPRLGIFHGREAEIPFDFEDVLSLIAPRPCLIDSPLHDRENDAEAVRACVDAARAEWRKHHLESNLTHYMRNDYNRFQPEHHRIVSKWLDEQTSK